MGGESFWHKTFAWAYDGVNHSLKGSGGEECINYIPSSQKLVETIVFTLLSVMEVWLAYRRVKLPEIIPPQNTMDRTGKKVILALHCTTFGIELGFKFASRQMIWVLNPCHLVTMMQIYLLVAPPSKLSMSIFRIHMHCLSGAVIAVAFPVLNTRLHIMMLVVPCYLMRLGGVFTPEPLLDMSWDVMTLGLLFFYHWTILQGLGIVSLVNLNNMLCPAVSDPFYGRAFRLWACGHQTALVLAHGKLYTWIAMKIVRKVPPYPLPEKRVKEMNRKELVREFPESECKCCRMNHANSTSGVKVVNGQNGHAKAQ